MRGLLETIRRALSAGNLEPEPTLIQVASGGVNDTLALIGSSPFGLVDPAHTFMQIPDRPTSPNVAAGSSNRYLMRLCGWSIPPGMAARVIAVGEYTEIGLLIDQEEGGGRYPLRRDVVSPGWTFPDGNIARGITQMSPEQPSNLLSDAGSPPSTTRNIYGLSPGLIYQGASPVPYLAPAGGLFPGSPIGGSLGLWRDGRFRWSFSSSPMDYAVEGPCNLVYWASIRQTDPESRPVLELPPEPDLGALLAEDRFVLQFPDAIYTRIGGFMVIETGPTSRYARRGMLPEGAC